MLIRKEIEFNKIINDILKNEEFIDLKYEVHHGITRLDHSLSVARLTYVLCKKFKVKNYVEVTRAALLHDFFKSKEIAKNRFINHPLKALENAKLNFSINKMQENIILSHMFPASCVMPKYKESYLVSFADKLVALKECTKYKIPLTIGATFLFMLRR